MTMMIGAVDHQTEPFFCIDHILVSGEWHNQRWAHRELLVATDGENNDKRVRDRERQREADRFHRSLSGPNTNAMKFQEW